MSQQNHDKALQRWRLALGRFSAGALPNTLDAQSQRMDSALNFLYSREYNGRGVRGSRSGDSGGGSLDPSQLTVPHWLNEVRELFPAQSCEIIEKDALERYELDGLFNDPQTLERFEPNQDLLKALMNHQGQMNEQLLSAIRKIIRQVVEELSQKLKREISQAFSGAINRQQHSPLKVVQNFDWRGTIQKNLKNLDPESGKLILQELRFFSRVQRKLPWTIILCVDQSGSMLDSVIHSAVMAGILGGLPGVELKLVVFDTSVVDLSNQVDDPVEVLMSVQLGGGTNIGQAAQYCEQLVKEPRRTVFALVTDFEEGAPPSTLYAAIKRLQEAGVTQIGLTALDDNASPYFDRRIAANAAQLGMHVAALTPMHFAEWLAEKMR